MPSKPKATPEATQEYAPGDVVLAKIRGFPAWPGMIVDPNAIPPAVAREKPSKIKNFHCVRFFTAGDYAFPIHKDISKLQPHEIEAYINDPVKSRGDLLSAYKVAQNPAEWIAKKEAEAAAAIEAAANASVDQLEESGEEGEGQASKKKEKKRKRQADGEKKAKSSKKAGEPGVAKKKSSSKKVVESEDDAAGESGAKGSGPPAKKAKRDDEDALEKDPEAKKVREWRHKLQKLLLNTKAPAKPEDIPGVDTLLTTIEKYEGMTLEYLTFSKIGKVMRHIHQLPDEKLPRDSEFNIRTRAQGLVEKWQSTHVKSTDGAPAGEAKDEKADEKAEDKAEDKAEPIKSTEFTNGVHAIAIDDKPKEDVAMAEA